MSYKDDAGDVEGDHDDQLDYAWQGGYCNGVDAVLSFLDAEASYQIRCLIEEGEI